MCVCVYIIVSETKVGILIVEEFINDTLHQQILGSASSGQNEKQNCKENVLGFLRIKGAIN